MSVCTEGRGANWPKGLEPCGGSTLVSEAFVPTVVLCAQHASTFDVLGCTCAGAVRPWLRHVCHAPDYRCSILKQVCTQDVCDLYMLL